MPGRYERANKPWTAEEDAQLLQLATDDATVAEAALASRRSREAVQRRAYKLGLRLKT
jgi:GAF domain-containing protein